MREPTKPTRIPASIWERIRAKAEREGRSFAEVLRDILSQIPDLEETTTPQERQCIFCGRPSGSHRICDECFYDPSVVRPQVIGAIYYHYATVIADQAGLKKDWKHFEAWLNKQIAIDYYGITEEEWQYYEEWKQWKRRFENGTATKESDGWRHFVRRGLALGFTGDRAGFRLLSVLFSSVGKRTRTKPSTF